MVDIESSFAMSSPVRKAPVVYYPFPTKPNVSRTLRSSMIPYLRGERCDRAYPRIHAYAQSHGPAPFDVPLRLPEGRPIHDTGPHTVRLPAARSTERTIRCARPPVRTLGGSRNAIAIRHSFPPEHAVEARTNSTLTLHVVTDSLWVKRAAQYRKWHWHSIPLMCTARPRQPNDAQATLDARSRHLPSAHACYLPLTGATQRSRWAMRGNRSPATIHSME